ncbi:hypothetical protein ACS0TY_009237 [Phlomoides rotata]
MVGEQVREKRGELDKLRNNFVKRASEFLRNYFTSLVDFMISDKSYFSQRGQLKMPNHADLRYKCRTYARLLQHLKSLDKNCLGPLRKAYCRSLNLLLRREAREFANELRASTKASRNPTVWLNGSTGSNQSASSADTSTVSEAYAKMLTIFIPLLVDENLWPRHGILVMTEVQIMTMTEKEFSPYRAKLCEKRGGASFPAPRAAHVTNGRAACNDVLDSKSRALLNFVGRIATRSFKFWGLRFFTPKFETINRAIPARIHGSDGEYEDIPVKIFESIAPIATRAPRLNISSSAIISDSVSATSVELRSRGVVVESRPRPEDNPGPSRIRVADSDSDDDDKYTPSELDLDLSEDDDEEMETEEQEGKKEAIEAEKSDSLSFSMSEEDLGRQASDHGVTLAEIGEEDIEVPLGPSYSDYISDYQYAASVQPKRWVQ